MKLLSQTLTAPEGFYPEFSVQGVYAADAQAIQLHDLREPCVQPKAAGKVIVTAASVIAGAGCLSLYKLA